MRDRSRSPVGRKRVDTSVPDLQCAPMIANKVVLAEFFANSDSRSLLSGAGSTNPLFGRVASPALSIAMPASISGRTHSASPTPNSNPTIYPAAPASIFEEGFEGAGKSCLYLQQASSPAYTCCGNLPEGIVVQDCEIRKAKHSEDSDCTSSTDVDVASLSCWEEDEDEDDFDLEEDAEQGEELEESFEYCDKKDTVGLRQGTLDEKLHELMTTALDGTSSLITTLAKVFTRLASSGSNTSSELTMRFHASTVPQISIHDYLLRIAKGFRCSDACLVLALVYVDRLLKLSSCSGGVQTYQVCELNVHRLLLASVLLATKVHDDDYYTIKYYARVGGISRNELRALETELLSLLQWRLFVSQEEFAEYLHRVLSIA